MQNCHFALALENFSHNGKAIDFDDLQAKMLKAVKDAGYSADGAVVNNWNYSQLPPAPKTA
jgi:hypothetical protein